MVEDGAGIPHLESEIRRLRDDLPSTKPATISLKTGDLFMARYRIMEELAAGCRGAVYQAENVQTNASVLIVLMLTEAIAREDVKPVSSNMSPVPEPAKPLLSAGNAGALVFYIFELEEIALNGGLPLKTAIRLMRWLDDATGPLLSDALLRDLMYTWLLQEDRGGWI